MNASDYILSIVPPRDALATAQRIVDASSKSEFKERKEPLYFLDLNAISPKSARAIDQLIAESRTGVRFIDGGIIGAPPSPSQEQEGGWKRPSIPTSGPYRLDAAGPSGEHLAETLNVKFVNETIGAASGLKMCFAALSKGFTALAIQSFTTASNLNVIPELKEHLAAYNPGALKQAEGSLVSMCPKAYRWVHEMREIGETFEADGGFMPEESSFRSIAEVYDLVANGTVLGEEKVGERKRGMSAEDVASAIAEGTAKRKEKME